MTSLWLPPCEWKEVRELRERERLQEVNRKKWEGERKSFCFKILNLNEVAQKIVTMSTQVSLNVFTYLPIKREKLIEKVGLEVKDLSVVREYKSRYECGEKDGSSDWERRRFRTSDLRQGKTEFLREERKWYQCDGSIGKWERCFGKKTLERRERGKKQWWWTWTYA